MNGPKNDRLPDTLLERYLAGDLSPERRRDIEARCAASPVLRARLEALRAAREEFLSSDPPHAFAARLSARAAAEPKRRSLWIWLAAPSVVAAAGLLVAVSFSRLAGDAPEATVPEAEWAAPQAVPSRAEPAAAEESQIDPPARRRAELERQMQEAPVERHPARERDDVAELERQSEAEPARLAPAPPSAPLARAREERASGSNAAGGGDGLDLGRGRAGTDKARRPRAAPSGGKNAQTPPAEAGGARAEESKGKGVGGGAADVAAESAAPAAPAKKAYLFSETGEVRVPATPAPAPPAAQPSGPSRAPGGAVAQSRAAAAPEAPADAAREMDEAPAAAGAPEAPLAIACTLLVRRGSSWAPADAAGVELHSELKLQLKLPGPGYWAALAVGGDGQVRWLHHGPANRSVASARPIDHSSVLKAERPGRQRLYVLWAAAPFQVPTPQLPLPARLQFSGVQWTAELPVLLPADYVPASREP